MKRLSIILIMSLMVFVGGCFNIFSPLFLDPKNNDLSQIYDPIFLTEMGDYYANLGDYIIYRKFYSRVLELNPTNSRALIGLANCAFSL